MTRGESLEMVPYEAVAIPPSGNLCKDCVWYKVVSKNMGTPQFPVEMKEHNCHNPYVTKEHTDVILGITHDRVSCNLARYGAMNVPGACGLEGKFWEWTK